MISKYLYSGLLIAGLGLGLSACYNDAAFKKEGEDFEKKVAELDKQEVKDSKKAALAQKKEMKKNEPKKDEMKKKDEMMKDDMMKDNDAKKY